jgi:hypothetical protein
MAYYLPASEHRMLKSPLCLSAARLLPHSERNEFPNFTDFLHGTE